ncbi:MAG TPA: hypothetical protein VHD36_04100 [Pirellulales bacterium]|nr:hypothetical protein [Pirellulales bacterium]
MNAVVQTMRRLSRYALLIAAAAAVGCAIGAVWNWPSFLRAYLYAWLVVLGLSLGGMALVMIHNLTGGVWGLYIRRIAEAQMRTLPLVAALAIPLVIGLRQIYPWASIEAEPSPSTSDFWRHYLEPSFFFGRAAGYFVVWLVLTALLTRWSRGQDSSPNVRRFWRAYKVSGFGLLALGVTVHFASIDWIMSLARGFTSTALGPVMFANQVLSAYSLCVVIGAWLVVTPEFEHIVSSKAVTDLGSLLLTMLTLWAYLAWFQFMLVWMADLPHDNVWYLVRWRDGWGVAGAILLLFQFVLPFFLLLLRVVKQSPRALSAVAALVFTGQLVATYAQVGPLLNMPGWANHWVDLLTPLALGGIWFASFTWLLARRPLLPVYDMNYEQAFLLREIDLEEVARDEALAHG